MLKTKALPISQCFLCTIILNRMAMQDSLHNRKVVIRRQTCVMCRINDESVNHLLFSRSATN